MVKLISFLPIVFAGRGKRNTEISRLEDAVLEFVDRAGAVVSNGCHCPALAGIGSHPAYFGIPKNNRDRACKQWMAARDCLFLSGGVCENEAAPSYSYDSSTGCNQYNACDKALCEIDTAFADKINALAADPFEIIAENNSYGECVRTNDQLDYDACCGSTLDTLTKYLTSESRCANNVVITENCPAGQQKNDDNVCEDCPANTFSSDSRCVPCNSNADILVVYDGSGTMLVDTNDGTGRTKWEVQRVFVENFVTKFEIASDKVRVSGVQYNKNPYYDWGFNDGDDATELQTRVNNIIQYDTSYCADCSQLQKVYNDFSNIFSDSRADAKKIILFLADGINGSNQDTYLQNGIDWAADNNAEIYFIRIKIGPNVGSATWSWEKFVLHEENFIETDSQGWGALDSLGAEISNKICSA